MSEKKHNYVYKITNLLNNKIYIGVHSTDDLNDGYMGSGIVLESAIKKHGVENFKKEILVDFDTAEVAYRMEKMLVDEKFVKRRDTYNVKVGGISGRPSDEVRQKISLAKRGKKLSEATRKKMSETRKGKRLSEETRKKISLKRKGKKHTPEAIEKMREAHKKENLSEETRKKLSLGSIGKKHTEETKRKMSILKSGKNNPNYGRKHTPEAIEKMREAARKQAQERRANGYFVKGKPHSEASRKKMSEAHMGKKHSPETIEKIREAARKHSRGADGRFVKGGKKGNS